MWIRRIDGSEAFIEVKYDSDLDPNNPKNDKTLKQIYTGVHWDRHRREHHHPDCVSHSECDCDTSTERRRRFDLCRRRDGQTDYADCNEKRVYCCQCRIYRRARYSRPGYAVCCHVECCVPVLSCRVDG